MRGIVFPGQGSQHPGMGKLYYDNFRAAQYTFEEASDALKIDFKKICFEGTESELQQTINTQPCLLLVSTAMWNSVKQIIGGKVLSAGHSLGEYSALVAAGVISFADAMRAVRKRGEFMQKAVPEGVGAMAAVLGLENEQVEQICENVSASTGEVLEPANYNSPGQVVVSGSAKAVAWLKDSFKPESMGIKRLKMIPLKVSAPFHCSLMRTAEENMTPVIQGMKFSQWTFPVIQNKTARIPEDLTELQYNLISQISSPVKWAQSVSYLKDEGVRQIIEVGSGQVLSGLVKKIDSEFVTFNIQTLDDINQLEKNLETP